MNRNEHVIKKIRRPKIDPNAETKMLGCKISDVEKQALKKASEKLGYPTTSYLVRTIIRSWVAAFNKTYKV